MNYFKQLFFAAYYFASNYLSGQSSDEAPSEVYRRTATAESVRRAEEIEAATVGAEYLRLATSSEAAWASSEWRREAEPRAFLSATTEKIGRSIAQMQKRVTMETIVRGLDERANLTV